MLLAKKASSLRDNDIDQLLCILPAEITNLLYSCEDLVEIVVDLGRPVEFRYAADQFEETDLIVTQELIDSILAQLSAVGIDNRCGINGTLHRISVIRNKASQVIGLTIRIGKPFAGNAILIDDLLENNKSILVMGAPSKGKTTLLREVAHILSMNNHQRVVIVDTSNEIAGEGDVPHAAVGRSRRLQVAADRSQHMVMIEAVENHNPQVIIIDEVSTEAESKAVLTISQRGVQIVATAHGNTLDNLILNPTLASLVGGIERVTLSDEQATLRGCQKTIHERAQDPPFDCIVEIRAFDEVAIHHSTADSVDALLHGLKVQPEVRRLVGGKVITLIPETIESKVASLWSTESNTKGDRNEREGMRGNRTQRTSYRKSRRT